MSIQILIPQSLPNVLVISKSNSSYPLASLNEQLKIYRVFKKKSFTNLKAYIKLFIGYVQCFELLYCSKVHRVLAAIATFQCDFHW
jgi:hypothetical protein